MAEPASVPLRVAIVGSGGMAVARAERIAARSDMQLVTIAGRNPDTRAALATRFGVEHTHDWKSTVARSDVDAVIVATHPDTHAPMGAAALAAGNHLFSESPLALTTLDAVRLLRLADQRGLVIRVGHTSPLRPGPRLVREQVAALGGALHDDLVVHFPYDLRAGRDAGFDQRISGHPLIYAILLGYPAIYARGPITHIAAAATMEPAGHAFDRAVAVVNLRFRDGGLATITYRRGFDGDSESGRTVICRQGVVDFSEAADHIGVTDADGGRMLLIPDGDPWNDELSEFVAAIREGRPMSVSAHEAARVVDIIDAARRAADAGSAFAEI
ncbi:MAG: Gfo/Idh/MocA family oxidoreductase [Chloroflexota bacterium]|nr:Gfo/Idh/MocA family oxidoreductase [Chloroflexota bacterium]MDE2897122.1 Gfo/Idh/MocA family oxidoreductase [Chloroflexota bacterium]